jgi:hypothetical protein
MVVEHLRVNQTMIIVHWKSPSNLKHCPCFGKSFSVSGCSSKVAILTSAVIRMQFSKEFAENIARPEDGMDESLMLSDDPCPQKSRREDGPSETLP